MIIWEELVFIYTCVIVCMVHRADVSLRDVTIVWDETGDGVQVTSRTGSARRFVGELKESEESWN